MVIRKNEKTCDFPSLLLEDLMKFDKLLVMLRPKVFWKNIISCISKCINHSFFFRIFFLKKWVPTLPNFFYTRYPKRPNFTCVALAKACLVMGPLCPSVRSSATLLGCLVFVIYKSKSFHSFLFKLCICIFHFLKMFTAYLVHIS